MKDVIVKLLGFYVEYRKNINMMKSDFWRRINYEWFCKPLSDEELMKLIRGDKK